MSFRLLASWFALSGMFQPSMATCCSGRGRCGGKGWRSGKGWWSLGVARRLMLWFKKALRMPPPRRLLVSCEPVLESSDSKVLQVRFLCFLALAYEVHDEHHGGYVRW